MPTEEQLQEIHRLAVRGEAIDIAQDVGIRLAASWLPVSRFREVRDLGLQTLTLGPHADTLRYLGQAKRNLGEVREALDLYIEALQRYEEVGDRQGLAATLNNIGGVYRSRGSLDQALDYFQQALPIREGEHSMILTPHREPLYNREKLVNPPIGKDSPWDKLRLSC